VIPKWTAHDVADWEELLVRSSNGKLDLGPATVAVLNYMPFIGVPTLTKENAVDAWLRITLFESVHGPLWRNVGEVGYEGRPYFVTKGDVIRHIGLETEGSWMTFAQFYEMHCVGRSGADTHDTAAFIANGGKSLTDVGKK
jgi:hypothetical protein